MKSFSLDEAREVFREHPHNLSLNELYLLVLNCPEGSQDFVDIFETAVRLFPHDPTANLNAAVAAQTIERLSAENAFCMTSRRQINTVLDGVDEATVNGQNTPDATKNVFSFDLERIVSQAVVSKASSLVATTTDVANSRVTVDLDNLNYAVINGATSVNFWLDNAGDRTITDVGAGTMKYNGLKSAIHDYLGDIGDNWNDAKDQGSKTNAKLIRLGLECHGHYRWHNSRHDTRQRGCIQLWRHLHQGCLRGLLHGYCQYQSRRGRHCCLATAVCAQQRRAPWCQRRLRRGHCHS